MVALPNPPMSGCAACSVAPAAVRQAETAGAGAQQIALSLPGIRCAGCISTVERVLGALPGVHAARVNLSLKQARIDAASEVMAATLVAALDAAGYEAHELDAGALAATETDDIGADLLLRLAVAGFAMMNVMLLSVAVWSGASDATRDLFHWISAAIVLPAVAFSGQPFFAKAWSALKARRLNMDVPITLAILLAIATSLWETSLSGEHAYFDAAIALTFFLLAGRYLDHRTRSIARSAAQELTALDVARATLLIGDTRREVATASLRPGDQVSVPPGGRMPVDGVIVEGRSERDRSLLTGETIPVTAAPGDVVSAGEINLTGPLTVRATATGSDTSLHRMAALVAVAESGRSRYTPLADAAAKLYAPGVHILAALSFLGWMAWAGDLRVALNIAAAVLIITCPCALGLAVPAVTTAASGRLFRRGMLVKHATALERLSGVDTVVFDKTGTLTTGTPVADPLDGLSDKALSIVAALASGSAHPLSVALAQAARTSGVIPARVTGLRELPGQGTEAQWQGETVRLGRAAWVGSEPVAATATYFRIGAAKPVALTFADDLRPGAADAVAALQSAGKRVVLLSGDSDAAVRRIAEELGIKDWWAGCLPEDKVTWIETAREKGAHVLMVGDGLNDTAALTAADVSISPASALDAARVASDIVLLGQSLEPIPEALAIASRATARIRENFRIATLYNIIAVPLAVAGLATPLIAALAMSASSITVSLNALRVGVGRAER